MTTSVNTAEDLPRVFGRYLLVQRLSSGGMGEVFLAKLGMSGFEKLCVIKKILPSLNEDEHFISRFVDEAQVAIHLQHASIAQVFEVGRVGGEYFLALEYVEGRDLRTSLRTLAELAQRFPLDMALLIGRDMANGLAYAHRRTGPTGEPMDLVHCDISPPNVMVSFEGEIKIIDFGIAKSAVRGTATDPKMGFGKFGYMAPEQLIRGGAIDHRTDIYAAGAVLFELLTGARLYPVDSTTDYRELARRVVQGQHPKPSELDPELAPFDDLVLKSLAPKPSQRFQNAAEFRDAIQQALVTLNPTISSDALGQFMRQLFAREMDEVRSLAARVRATDMTAWQAQLANQSSSTVSFALVAADGAGDGHDYEDETGAIYTGVELPPGAQVPVRPAELAAVSLPAAAPGPQADVVTLRAPAPGPSRRGFRVLVAALLVFGAAVAFAATRGVWPGAATGRDLAADSSGHGGEQPASEPVVTALVAGDPDGGIERAVEPGDAGVRDPQGDGDAAVAEPADSGPVKRASSSRTKKRRRGAADGKRGSGTANPSSSGSSGKTEDKTPEPEKGPTRAEVEATFRAVNQEYRAFQKSYGARLDDKWGDLVHAIQFAQSPDKLTALSKKLQRFRAEMRAIQNGDSP